MRIEEKVCRFLKLLDVPVNKEFLEDRIQSHPNYPNLVSITDTFDEIGFIYSAVLIDKSDLYQVQFPIIGQIAGNKGMSLEIIYSKEDLSIQGLMDRWNGIALVMPRNQLATSSEYTTGLSKSRRLKFAFAILVISILFFIIINATNSFPFYFLIFQYAGIAGLVFSIIAFLIKYDRNISIARSFCGRSNSNCSNIIKSKKLPVPFNLNLGDISLAYFISLVSFLSIFYQANSKQSFVQLLQCTSLISALVSIGSIYYQKFVAKAWCRVCLAIIAICLIQGFAVFMEFHSFHFDIDFFKYLFIFVGAFITAISFIEVVNFNIYKLYEGRSFRKQVNSYSRNITLFRFGLDFTQRIVLDQWVDEIIFGSPNSSFKVTIVCNPFCDPCANAHKILSEIIQHNVCQISVAVRFAVDTSVESPSLSAARLIFSAIEYSPEKSFEILHRWFNEMNIYNFQEYTIAHSIETNLTKKVDDLILKHESWARKVNIEYTPTIFVNGFRIKNRYSIRDLKIMLPDLIQLFEMIDSSTGPIINDVEESDRFQMAETPSH